VRWPPTCFPGSSFRREGVVAPAFRKESPHKQAETASPQISAATDMVFCLFGYFFSVRIGALNSANRRVQRMGVDSSKSADFDKVSLDDGNPQSVVALKS